MPFFGDTIGAYMLPRVVLELLQQPGGQQQCGVCADSGFAWLLSGKQLYVWRYREGKEARLRVLTLPRQPPPPPAPCAVALIADNRSPSASASSSAPAVSALLAPPTSAITPSGPAAADGSLTVAVCDADGRLTVWLDAHHLAAPVEHQLLLTPASPGPAPSPAADGGSGGLRPPLLSAFAAARLDLGAGPAFLAALSASDGSLHLIQAGSQGIFAKQLVAAPGPPAESRGLVGALGSALGRVLADAFEPSSRYLRKAPAARPAVALHLAPSAGGGGQHYRLLVLTRECLDCWAISVGLRPCETLQWSFANCLVRQYDSRRGEGGPTNLDLAVGVGASGGPQGGPGGGQLVAIWMAEPAFNASRVAAATAVGPGGEAGEMRQHVVQLLELLPESGPAVCSSVQDLVRGYDEPPEPAGTSRSLRRLLYSSHSHTCLLARWQQTPTHSQLPQYQQQYYTAADAAAAVGAASRVCQALWTWDAATGAATALSDDPDTTAVDIAAGDAGGAGGAARWVVLSATYGVMEIAAAPAAAAPPGAVSGGLDPAAMISNLLDAVLSQAATITAAGGNLQPLAGGLGRRLAALGALGSPMGQSTLATYSTQLLDLLPKQWAAGSSAAALAVAAAAAGSGGGGLGGGGVALTVAEQLSYKEYRHKLLLQCLALSGLLHALGPEVLRVLLENSEKLAVVGALHHRQAHHRDTGLHTQGAEGAGQGDGGGGGAAATAALLSRLVAEAGQESSATEYEVLSPSEIFYSRPSASVPHFLAALGRTAAGVAGQAASGLGNPGDSALGSLRATVRELGALAAEVVSAVGARRDLLAAGYHLSSQEVAGRLGRPDWLAGADTRAALEQLTKAIQVVRPQPASPHSMELSHTLYGATDVLLTCYGSAVSAVSAGPGRGGDPAARATLLAAYREVRGRCARELLADARAEMEAAGYLGPGGAAGPAARVEPLPPGLLMCQLETLFRAHHCYPQLFDVCEALAAADPSLAPRLFTHMATMPPEDAQLQDSASASASSALAPTMARYVYERLLADGRPADLLDLPRQFHEGVTSFLQSLLPAYSELLAVHLMRNGALGDAAAVLLQRAVTSSSLKGTNQQPQQVEGGCGLGPPRRMLSLARLAARAAAATDLEAAAARQLQLLGLQARLGLPTEGPLEPAVVLEEALALATNTTASTATETATTETANRSKEAAVVAIELMALMAAADRAAHASKWQRAWRAVFDADPWDEVAEARIAAEGSGGGGGLDEAAERRWVALMGRTAVCRAAAACARSETLGFGANVVDSAPLDQVARWLRSWATAASPTSDPLVARREGAVMSALRLGVEGQQRGGAGRREQPAAVAMVSGAEEAGGLLDMAVD